MAEAVQNTMTVVSLGASAGVEEYSKLTDREDDVQQLTADDTAEDVAGVGEAVDFRMPHLERAKERGTVW